MNAILAGAGAVVVGLLSATGNSASAQSTLAWDKTFPQSPRVAHQKVTFYNRLGINLVGDLYVPRNLDRSRRHAAIIVGHPYGGVKEQTSGLYAQTMAERGFITLAFDASYNGESGGQPHFIASHEAFVEDFSAAVDYLGSNALVDRDRIGIIGVCGSGGFSLAAAQIDPRIKAVATVSMYDIGQATRQGLTETLDKGALKTRLAAVAAQRWAEVDGASEGDGDRNARNDHRGIVGDRPGVLRLLPHAARASPALDDGDGGHRRCADDAVLGVRAPRLDLSAPGVVHHGRQGALAPLQRARLRESVGAEGALRRSRRRSRRPVRPREPDSLGQAHVVLHAASALSGSGAMTHICDPGRAGGGYEDSHRCQRHEAECHPRRR